MNKKFCVTIRTKRLKSVWNINRCLIVKKGNEMTGQYEEKIAKANRKVAVANNILKYGYDCEPYLGRHGNWHGGGFVCVLRMGH